MKYKRQVLAGVLAVAAVGFLILALYLMGGSRQPAVQTAAPTETVPTAAPDLEGTPPSEETPAPEATPIPDEVDGLPVGKWVVTAERKEYKDGALTLYIPKLDVTRTIWAGTDADTLSKGVGLYDYAQLPGEGNRNVSLAGHRNGLKNGKITDHAPFYYIDQLTDGDYLYLYDSAHIYRYVYEWTEVVEPDDWGPIATTGYSCVTITSCEPIGISDHRIVVRAVLDGTFDYTEDFAFTASEEAS